MTSIGAAGLAYPSTEELLDETASHAMQALPRDRALVRLAHEALMALTGEAARAVLAARADQIAARGHTAERDDELPQGFLAGEARVHCSMAFDVIAGSIERRNLAVGKRRLARAAALCMAEYDRLTRLEAAAAREGNQNG